MSEPLKPRIDFSGPLDVDQRPAFKAQQMFDDTQAQTFLRLNLTSRWQMKDKLKRSLMLLYVLSVACGAKW